MLYVAYYLGDILLALVETKDDPKADPIELIRSKMEEWYKTISKEGGTSIPKGVLASRFDQPLPSDPDDQGLSDSDLTLKTAYVYLTPPAGSSDKPFEMWEIATIAQRVIYYIILLGSAEILPITLSDKFPYPKMVLVVDPNSNDQQIDYISVPLEKSPIPDAVKTIAAQCDDFSAVASLYLKNALIQFKNIAGWKKNEFDSNIQDGADRAIVIADQIWDNFDEKIGPFSEDEGSEGAYSILMGISEKIGLILKVVIEISSTIELLSILTNDKMDLLRAAIKKIATFADSQDSSTIFFGDEKNREQAISAFGGVVAGRTHVNIKRNSLGDSLETEATTSTATSASEEGKIIPEEPQTTVRKKIATGNGL